MASPVLPTHSSAYPAHVLPSLGKPACVAAAALADALACLSLPPQDIQVIPGTSNPRLCLISDEYSPSVAVVNCDVDHDSCGEVGMHARFIACACRLSKLQETTLHRDELAQWRDIATCSCAGA